MELTMKNGLRWSTYPAYIKPILQRTNLKIYRYSRVVKVIKKQIPSLDIFLQLTQL